MGRDKKGPVKGEERSKRELREGCQLLSRRGDALLTFKKENGPAVRMSGEEKTVLPEKKQRSSA